MIQEEIHTLIDKKTFRIEKDVKDVVRKILDRLGVFHFMPPSNVYATVGISDILVVADGKAIAIETKVGYNKPTAQQLAFGKRWSDAGGLFLVINDKNIKEKIDLLVKYIRGNCEHIELFDGGL